MPLGVREMDLVPNTYSKMWTPDGTSAKKKVGFALLVMIFTIFGGGQIRPWTNICQDQQGLLYEADLSTVKKDQEMLSLRVRISDTERSGVNIWTLNTRQNTLRIGRGETQKILSGSVAAQLQTLLRSKGLLPPLSLIPKVTK